MRGIAVITACLMLAVGVQAQFPIGHPTPIGGYAPLLFGEPLWLGNPGYGYRIQGAPPGAAAFVAVTAQRQDHLVGGLQVYLSLDVADLLVIHSGFTDPSGQALFSIPLAGPDVPALAGVTAYAQAAVADPASPGTLRHESGPAGGPCSAGRPRCAIPTPRFLSAEDRELMVMRGIESCSTSLRRPS